MCLSEHVSLSCSPLCVGVAAAIPPQGLGDNYLIGSSGSGGGGGSDSSTAAAAQQQHEPRPRHGRPVPVRDAAAGGAAGRLQGMRLPSVAAGGAVGRGSMRVRGSGARRRARVAASW